MGQFSLTCRLCGPYWRPSAGCRSHITRNIFIHAPYILLRCLPRHLPAANSPKITSKTLVIGRSCMTCSLCGALWRSNANCRSIFPRIISSHEQYFLINCLQRHSPSAGLVRFFLPLQRCSAVEDRQSRSSRPSEPWQKNPQSRC